MPKKENNITDKTVEKKINSETDKSEDTTVDIKQVGAIVDIYSRLVALDTDKVDNDSMVIIPSGSKSTIDKFLSDINNIETDAIEDVLSTEELVSIGVNHISNDNTYPEDALVEKANNDADLVNSVTYAGKQVGIRKIDITASGKLTGSNAVAKFTSALGIGKHVSITLWHSGFSLVIAPPKESDIISMHFAIAKLERSLGASTNNFIYSNYGVVINKILLDFIMRHVVSSSLSLPEDSSYLDYIKVTDINTLAVGIATAIRPDGYPVTVTCKNTLKVVNEKPLCDYTVTADIIPENLVWVNRSILTPELLEHISKTQTNSHTVDSVLHYQELLTVNDENEAIITDNSDNNITFIIQTPMISTYIDSGVSWVNKVISDAEELFTDNDDDATKENKVDTMVVSSVLNKYNSYIKLIKVDDSYVDDTPTITTLLEVMSSDGKLTNNLLSSIMEHINNNYISLVATYDFNCPRCAEEDRSPEQGGSNISGFKEFIPLNGVDNFFDLSTLKFTQIMKREK